VCADHLVFAELSGPDDGFANVQQLAVPPHLFGRSASTNPRSEPLNQLFAIHQ
jgi:hypothetical protein